ncbi:MAG: GNAT family N-acetyltransferase [Bradymonadia bacterium]
MKTTKKEATPGQLVKLDNSHQDMFQTFIGEFEPEKDPLHGYFIDVNAPFETVLEILEGYETGDPLPEGWVPSTTWFWMHENTIKGVINLRHWLTPGLEAHGGHIGYTVAPSHRRQGIATAMLAGTLARTKELNIERVLVSCDAENIGSRRAIEINGGVLQREEWDETLKRTSNFYWITPTS